MQNYYSNWIKTPKTTVKTNAEVDWKLLNNIRQDIIGELDAINQYTTHINETTNPEMIRYWKSIRAEEETHVGELMNALFRMSPETQTYFDKGVGENRQN